MTITDELTPTTYELVRIGIERDGTDVVAIADLRIRNADGKILAIHNPGTTLTPGEKAALGAFVNRELGAFEAAEGLTEWVPPVEEEAIP